MKITIESVPNLNFYFNPCRKYSFWIFRLLRAVDPYEMYYGTKVHLVPPDSLDKGFQGAM